MVAKKRSCLSIAGLDPSGGAGILVDAMVFQSLGFHAACVASSLTVQDTERVSAIVGVGTDLVKQQLEVVARDLEIAAVKTGALWSKENVRAVAEFLQRLSEKPCVVDPVLKAKRGEKLFEDEAVDELVGKLLPLASIATPNVNEASELTKIEIRAEGDVEDALLRLKELGVKVPLLKGWVRDGKVVDAVLYEGRVHFLSGEPLSEARGSGCVFSAALTAHLAMGLDPLRAVIEARKLTRKAIKRSNKVGSGFNVVDPAIRLRYEEARLRALEDVKRGVKELEAHPELSILMPEVRMNLVAIPEGAEEASEAVGIEGRITLVNGKLRASGPPWFGASSHLARLLVEVHKHLPEVKAALNIKYSPRVVEACRGLGLKLAKFRREEEPPEVREVEGASMRWAVEQVLRELREGVDAIYDDGGVGREAMVRLLGRSVDEVLGKAVKIASALSKRAEST
ncbi:MAG: bifunctional hydroxymethylpyrimidine kinase/phosphomethylpyrimidine kinase [Candidatus Nezhaarchaeota archaeon]|nr:bifunctional hydroxymethylpyrimidine kinase/phosphomethylpyrimidine kinase [Candidatus Nezhaarchaeota archaeon]